MRDRVLEERRGVLEHPLGIELRLTREWADAMRLEDPTGDRSLDFVQARCKYERPFRRRGDRRLRERFRPFGAMHEARRDQLRSASSLHRSPHDTTAGGGASPIPWSLYRGSWPGTSQAL